MNYLVVNGNECNITSDALKICRLVKRSTAFSSCATVFRGQRDFFSFFLKICFLSDVVRHPEGHSTAIDKAMNKPISGNVLVYIFEMYYSQIQKNRWCTQLNNGLLQKSEILYEVTQRKGHRQFVSGGTMNIHRKDRVHSYFKRL